MADQTSEKYDTPFYGGIEVLILREIAKVWNWTLLFRFHNDLTNEWGHFMDNGTTTGLLEETASGVSDMTMGGHLAKAGHYAHLDPSKSYIEDTTYWYVPGPREVPTWKSIYRVFDTTIWSFILSIYLLVTGIMYVLSNHRWSVETKAHRDYSFIVIWTWLLQTGMPAFRPRFVRMRVVYIMVAMYGVHLQTAYQSGLFSVLTTPGFESPIKSLREALRSEMKICVWDGAVELFYEQQDEELLEMYTKLHLVQDNYRNCLDKVSKNRDHISMVSQKVTEYNIPIFYLDEHHRSMLATIQRKIVRYPVSMYFTKGSPFVEPANSVIIRLVEAGIVKKWWRDIKFSKVNYKLTTLNKSFTRKRVLFLNQLSGGFFIYLLLNGVSVLLFFGEVVWCKLGPIYLRRCHLCWAKLKVNSKPGKKINIKFQNTFGPKLSTKMQVLDGVKVCSDEPDAAK